MDDSTKRFLQRLVRRIPTQMLETTLEKWGRLSRAQQQSVDFSQTKWAITEKLIAICEENEFAVKHLTELEMIYVIDNPNQGMWYAFQLMDPEDDAHSVELTQFKEQFKAHLKELVRNVSVKIKKHTDEAVWIRVAWGDAYSRPNHLKPTYVVHYLQTPYVFVTSLTSKQKPLLSQALVLSTRHQAVKDANLSGRKLTAIRDLLMRQYQQVFPTKYPSPLAENNHTVSHPHIEREQAEPAANRLQMASEAFGGGILPQLQSAVYKLETKFRDHTNKTMTEREEPFRCVVKFASTNLLESLRNCASSGIASTPVTPLLSSIPLKGRNYFVITDNGPGPSSQTRQQQN
ncbi:centromere protein N [Plectropomus leopardus]|uniref:centromere protein N n=1 Tax=Plectropomus leopardus TaxID=160734 RepID=UPI001C4D1B1B|nr:centromere protein N [Plectropomus leopardus]